MASRGVIAALCVSVVVGCETDSGCPSGHSCDVPASVVCSDAQDPNTVCGSETCCSEGHSCQEAASGVAYCLPKTGVCMEDEPHLERKSVDNRNGLNVSYLEGGNRNGQLLVFIHGFPEHSGTWRAQLTHFAARGFWVVAYDQRGYGSTTGWNQDDVESFSAMNLARDAVGLIQAIGGTNAVLIGHDWGSVTAYFTAVTRPDIVNGVVCMSVPLVTPAVMDPAPGAPIVDFFTQLYLGGLQHYQQFLTTPEAEAAILADPRTWVENLYRVSMGESPFKVDLAAGETYPLIYPQGEDLFYRLLEEHPYPTFLEADVLDTAAAGFAANGARGALNYYRMYIRNFEDLQLFAAAEMSVPYAFIGGEHDLVVEASQLAYSQLDTLKGFTRKDLVPGAGHWVQQEKPEETIKLIQKLLRVVRRRERQNA